MVTVEALHILFAEELGLVIEVEESQQSKVLEAFSTADVPASVIGHCYTAKDNKQCQVSVARKFS